MSHYTKAVKTGRKENIPVFISIGQNNFTAFYVSKYCFASFDILFFKNLNYKQLIEIRDGYKECFGFTQEDINNYITNLCTK